MKTIELKNSSPLTEWTRRQVEAQQLELYKNTPARFVLGANVEQVYTAVRIPDDYIWSPPPSEAFLYGDLVETDLRPLTEHLDKLNKQMAESMKTQPEETTMIEKKDFVTPPVKTPAGSLAQRHIGSLVTITLPSGAEITDVLVGVMSGVPYDSRRGNEHDGRVVLYLKNVGVGYDPDYLRDRNGEFPLDSKSVVLVRRPKATKVTVKRK